MITHKINTYNNDTETRFSRTQLHLTPNWDEVHIFIPIVFYRGNDAIIIPLQGTQEGLLESTCLSICTPIDFGSKGQRSRL